MTDWKKEREKIEASIAELHLHLTSLPEELQNSEAAKVIRGLLKKAQEKVELLKKSEGGFWS